MSVEGHSGRRWRVSLSTKTTVAFLATSVAAALPGLVLVSSPELASRLAFRAHPMVLPALTFFTALLSGAVAGRWMSDGLTRRVSAITAHAARLGEGDLRAALAVPPPALADETDDLVASMRAITERLRELVEAVRAAADEVADAAVLLSETARQTRLRARQVVFTVSEAAQAVAEHADRVARTREEISDLAAATEESARAVGITRSASERSAQMAGLGRDVAEGGLSRVEALFRELDALAGRVYRFGEHTGEIREVARLIGEISRQTDVLAINAGIELARRDHPDPGLQRVAGEVRRLSDRVARASETISGLAEVLSEESRGVVQAMRAGGQELQAGRGDLASIASAMARITSLVDEAAERTQGVAELAERQRRRADDLGRAVEEVSREARANAVVTDDVQRSMTRHSDDLGALAGEAQDLSELARRLRERLGTFSLPPPAEPARRGASAADDEEDAAPGEWVGG